MKQLLVFIFVLISLNFFGQKTKEKVLNQKASEKYESMQPQDFSVPPPPINHFPAQFPEGNKKFVEKIVGKLNNEDLKSQPNKLTTELILKIDKNGKVINISAYGNNQVFNDAVIKIAKQITNHIIWNPAQNKAGDKVMDLVKLPVKFLNQ